MPFALHPRLAAGTFRLGTAESCLILLKNNARFPWLLVVPEVSEGVEDLHQLEAARYEEVMSVMRAVSIFVETHFKPDKLNVGCIGNIVRQMHIHVVGRSESDPAWPGTVWASDAKNPYERTQVDEIQNAAHLHLNLH